MNETMKVISENKVMDILFAAFFLFLILRLIQKGLVAQTRKKAALTMVHRVFPMVEITSWIMFLVWVSRHIFQTGTVGSLVSLVLITLLLIGVGGFALRDWIAGMVFNMGNLYTLDDRIRVRDMEGTVTNLGYRCLYLKTEYGGSVEIPYSTLVKANAIEKLPPLRKSQSFTFTLSDKEITHDVSERLRTIAWCSPWSAIASAPLVRLTKTDDGTIKAEVTVFTTDSDHGPEIESYIRKNLD